MKLFENYIAQNQNIKHFETKMSQKRMKSDFSGQKLIKMKSIKATTDLLGAYMMISIASAFRMSAQSTIPNGA